MKNRLQCAEQLKSEHNYFCFAKKEKLAAIVFRVSLVRFNKNTGSMFFVCLRCDELFCTVWGKESEYKFYQCGRFLLLCWPTSHCQANYS